VILPYLHYDVFTGQALAGNQLAVFPDGRDLDSETMQRVAREMNFSESTFVLPAERNDTDARMRIFTPSVEMPMAGHPTIGSTFALAQAGVIAPRLERFVFGLNVGPVAVDLEWSDAQLRFAWMTQGMPEFGASADRAPVAPALGLGVDDVRSELPVQQVSCGVPYLIVPLRDQAAVDRAATDHGALRRLQQATGVDLPLYLFAQADPGSPIPDPARVFSCRMFAPGLGVLEDPGTGSAAGPLGAYLVHHGVVGSDGPWRIVIEQGVVMGRPSRIEVVVTGRSEAMMVKVGGEAVLVGRGELFL